MRTSDAINEIAAALAKAQAEIKNATLNKTNPHFKSKYADLAAIRDAITPALTKNNIAVVHTTMMESGVLLVHSRMIHASGQWIESEWPITGDTSKPQIMMSAYTYAKRAIDGGFTNIASEEDDDGNSAQANGRNGNGHHHETGELTGNANVKGYKPPATATSQAANDARAAAEYYKTIEREIDEIKTEGDLDDWFADKRDELNARLAKSYVNTVKDKLAEKREEFAAARPS